MLSLLERQLKVLISGKPIVIVDDTEDRDTGSDTDGDNEHIGKSMSHTPRTPSTVSMSLDAG